MMVDISRDDLHRIARAVPGDIAVYRVVGSTLETLYYSEGIPALSGLSDEDYQAMIGKDAFSIVIPDDRTFVRDVLKRCLSSGSDADCVYRIFHREQGYAWIHARSHVAGELDGAPAIITTYATESTLATLSTMKENYERTLHQLLAMNPLTLCSFRLNLTHNTCEECFGSEYYNPDLAASSTVDELVHNVAGLISDPVEKERFQKSLSRQNLLDAFAQGTTSVSESYRRRMDDGRLHWITTRNDIMQDPVTLDVVTAVSVIDDDERITENQIFEIITSEDYDYIATIYPEDSSIRIFYYNPILPTYLSQEQKKHVLDYDYVCDGAAKSWVHPQSVAYFQEMRALSNITSQLRANDHYSYEIDTIGNKGETRRKELSYTTLDKVGDCILVMQRDITKLHAEQQQRQEDLARQIAREQALKDEALRANQMKSEFLSNVSHDMRTPLNAVLGYTYLASKTEDCPEDVRMCLDKITRSGNILLQLINDTLDLNKIETGAIELKPEPIDLRTIMGELGNTLKPLMEAKHIDFEVSFGERSSDRVLADPLRMNEILLNQLANAVKFTPEGGTIRFLLERLTTEGDIAHDRIIISDTGCGMSKEFQSRLFEPFAQERTPQTADIEGSGLGLSIVKRLVEMMGGRIEVLSELGAGTTFTTYLDFRIVAPAEGSERDHMPGRTCDLSLQGRRVLLVEDNQMNSEIARNILELQGAEVVCAFDGSQGVDVFSHAQEGSFDVILMDVRMPVMDGYAATRAIRALDRPDARTIPIIAMTANAYADDVNECLAAGMDAHLAKPIDPSELVSAVAGKRGR